MKGRDEPEVQLMGTEEQVQTAKGLIEDFVRQTSGLSCLLYFILNILLSLNSMHSKNVFRSFVIRLFIRPSISLKGGIFCHSHL